MLQLHTFGALDLTATDGSSFDAILAQPKRSLLLAYLATATPRGYQRRDVLVALFWPELDTERARGALRKALHFLRTALGDAIITRGDEVGIDAEALSVDVIEFERAVAEGRCSDAMALYRGDFLPGVFAREAPDVERWIAGENTRLKTLAVKCAWALADAAPGQQPQAVPDLAARAAALTPYDEEALRRQMRLLEQVGARTTALGVYDDFARELARDFDGQQPGKESRDLRDAIRVAVDAAVVSSSPTLLREPPPAGAIRVEYQPAEVAAGATVIRNGRSVRSIAAVAVAVGALVFAAVWAMRDGHTAAATAVTDANAARTIAVMPFTIRGGNVAYLRDGMVDLLSISLQGAGDVEVVEPIALLNQIAHDPPTRDALSHARATARKFNAGNIVLGTIVDAGGKLEARVALYITDSNSQEPVSVVTGSADEAGVTHLVDDLTRSILAGMLRSPGSRLSQLATQTTTSLSALKEYLRGTRSMRMGQYADAIDAYQHAVQIDSGFALAYYGLSMAKGWASGGDDHDATLLAINAVRHTRGLSAHDSLLLAAHAHHWTGLATDAEAEYRSLLSSYPSDVEAWHELGEVIFHAGSLTGHPLRDARDAFAHVVGIEAFRLSALNHLARIAAAEFDSTGLDTLANMARDQSETDPRATEIIGLRAFVTGDSAERAETLRAAASRSDRAVWLLAWDVANYAGSYRDAEVIARLLTLPDKSIGVRAIGWSAIAQFRAAAGRPEAVRNAVRETRSFDKERGAYIWAFLAAMPLFPMKHAELVEARAGIFSLPEHRNAAISSATLAAIADLPMDRRELADAITVRLGDGSRLAGADIRDEWFRAEVSADSALSDAAQDTGVARARVERISKVWLKGYAGHTPRAESVIRFARAGLLESLGQFNEAERWFGTFPIFGRDEIIFRAPATLRLARLTARRGDTTTAAVLNRRVKWLWRDAEPGFTRSAGIH